VRLTLKCHPETPCEAVREIEVEVFRSGSGFDLTYRVTGTIADLVIPTPAATERRDELWRRTCLEAFVRAEDQAGYREFNFAPSTEWAAYSFDGYRSGMRDLPGIAPQIVAESAADRFTLRVRLDPRLPPELAWHLGLSAVIEEQSGRKSYWALAHPPGAPDFHHQDCFALQLPPAL
jgi:hypothetical protein